ncbi:uncharacterized protein LOC121430237 [Lytechinus variegatus]|uniref:uncharacterized protein LOC121430237 n=1 Tax=Lytechinus variegatus TaxID=7654 RepID=UPI001BB19D31|nr:uncharacterized protein LOC121430237 [Lytechinus variegatus]
MAMMGASKKSHQFLLAFLAAFSIFYFLQCELCPASKTNNALSNDFKASFFVMTCNKLSYISPTSSRRLDFQSTSLVHLSLLLLLSGQVETNPGPHTNGSEGVYPCAICGDCVRDSDPAILCDTCNYWCHISCVGISARSYDQLLAKSRSFAWNCFQCGSINIGSSSSLQGLDFTDTNSFSPLDDSQLDSSTFDSFPVTSTPTRSYDSPSSARPHFSSPQPRSSKRKQKAFKVMTLNCNGLKGSSKRSSFHAAITQHSPDIILGCESKLNTDIPTYSIFPSNYIVFRKDRNQHGGGVFISVRDDITVSECPHLATDCELLWCTIELTNTKKLFLGSYYCPPNDRQASLTGLENSLASLMGNRRAHPNILIAGDFNHPDIDWDEQTTTNPSSSVTHQNLLDILLTNSLFQVVREVTRPSSGNILDLICTSNPGLVDNVEVLPGISDHHLLTYTVKSCPKLQPKPPRKIHQFNKADIYQLKQAARDFSDAFLLSDPEKRSVETNWMMISNFLSKCLTELVPSKMSRGRRNLPWITQDIKQKMRKRDRLYKKACHQNTGADWEVFRRFRNQVAKTVHKAHDDYINNIIGASLSDNPKAFWSYIKSCRTEQIGIPPLRTASKLCSVAADKAEALNIFFHSMFTQENTQSLPSKGQSSYPSIGHLHIDRRGVEKQLKQLNPSKASGPDEIPPKLLKLIACEIARVCLFISTKL